MAYEGSDERGWQNATGSCLMVAARRKWCRGQCDSLESSFASLAFQVLFFQPPSGCFASRRYLVMWQWC